MLNRTLEVLKLVEHTLKRVPRTRVPGEPIDGCRDTYAVATAVGEVLVLEREQVAFEVGAGERIGCNLRGRLNLVMAAAIEGNEAQVRRELLELLALYPEQRDALPVAASTPTGAATLAELPTAARDDGART